MAPEVAVPMSIQKGEKRILLMRGQPTLVTEGGTFTFEHVRPACLFRLLVLREGRPVLQGDVAKLFDTKKPHVRGKIKDLRNELRHVGLDEDFVETVDGVGYRIDTAGWFVDAIEFTKKIERAGDQFDPSSERPISVGEAELAVTHLSEALRLWEENPGHGLVRFGYDSRFDELKLRAERRLITARLATANVDTMRLAIQDIEARIDRNDIDPGMWRLLLLAHHALVNTGLVHNTAERILRYYPLEKVPPRLQALIKSVMQSETEFANPFRLSRASGPKPTDSRHSLTDAERDRLVELCTTVGVTPESELKLKGTHMEPLPCIQRTRARLYFSGVLASKWVTPEVLPAFEELLTHLDATGGQARFMAINPYSAAYQRLHELREGALDSSSLMVFAQLLKAHPSLQMRVFDNLPTFRIIVIDTTVVYCSPYRLAAQTYADTKGGLEAPHLALDPLAPYPLSEAFVRMFEETWEHAHDLRALEGMK